VTLPNATWSAIRHRFTEDEREDMSFAQTAEKQGAFVLDASRLPDSLRVKLQHLASRHAALKGVNHAE
jgi:hypothetical protein